MYDKKQALGFILIIMVVMTYTQFVFAPYQQAPQPAAQTSHNQNTSSPQTSNHSTSSGANANSTAQESLNNQVIVTSKNIPSLAEIAAAPKTTIQSDLTRISISHLGARLASLELEKVKKDIDGTEKYNLISAVDGQSLPGGLSYGNQSDEGLLYTISDLRGFEKLSNGELSVTGNAEISFTATSPANYSFNKTFRFNKHSYLFGIEAKVVSSDTSPRSLNLSWPIHVNQELLHQTYDPYFFSILFSDNNKAKHFPAIGDFKELSLLQNADWIAFGDRYFSTAIMPSNKLQNVRVDSDASSYIMHARGESNSVMLNVFSGPKIYYQLKNQGLQLERTIDLGFFSFVAYPLLQLLNFLFSILGNYGVAIVALTLIVKTAFYPLNKASLNSMRAMQELSPEINELRARIKDSTQLNQEMLALYKRKGVNPMGGCLPIFIQIPVFFGLYSALQNAVELRHAPFALWVKDLATPEKLHFLGINFPLMVLAMGLIMFIQQYRTPMPNVDASQRKVMLGMSLMFTVMFLVYPFPAGLALYMLVNTTISLVQQQCIKSETMNKPFQMTVLASIAILAIAYIFSKF